MSCRSNSASLLTAFLAISLLSGCGQKAAPVAEADEVKPSAAGDSAKAKERETEHKPHAANLLAKETSPYLLLHAHNPVHWRPWGAEALEKARREKKLIFLSIGYSSCYWCHVMERESFMDEQIAAYLNEHFVAIKVDREERPDIDDIYMTSLHALGQRGGWPLSMFLTPDAKPLVGGTYFPPRERDGRPGFIDVLKTVEKAWTDEPQGVQKQADALAEHVAQQMAQRPVVVAKLQSSMLDDLMAGLEEQFDPTYGGFGYAENQPLMPKFPEPSNLVFLLDRLERNPDDAKARRMLLLTLQKMARGGIQDHLGGGFHRYSTDRFWRIPHFEKMLYDNGQLASVYARAFALTADEEFRRAVESIGDYVLREMTDDASGFYSALDAETDAEEGKFYVWEQEELKAALTDEEFALLAAVYGVDGPPNFEGRWALQLDQSLAEIAAAREATEESLLESLAPIRAKLLAVRGKRERPLTDTKILAGWNGLMITGLADAGRILKRQDFVDAATGAADYVLETHRDDDGRLLRTSTAGKAKLNGYLDDYACMIQGLLALEEATGDARWLEAADALMQKQLELFWDDRAGGFFFTSHDHEALIARSKDPVDGAAPAGNSVSANNLLHLSVKLDKPEYLDRAQQTIQAATPLLENSPTAVPLMATALAEYLELTKVESTGKEVPSGNSLE